MSHGWEPLLSFDRQDADEAPFVHGIECGCVWERAKHIEEEFSQMVHAENAEMMLRIGEALGRQVRCVVVDDVWIDVTVEATP